MAIETVNFQSTTIASPPSGTAVAVDTIAGAEYQVIKIALGADGSFDTLVDSGQQTMANSIPVAIASNQSNVPISIEADNVGIGGGTQYVVDAPLGATPTGTLAIAIRDDALSALTPVEGDAIGLRVDANGALWVIPSGTVTVTDNGSFTLAANSGVDIGDVDVLTIPATAGEGAALPSVFVVVAGDDGTDTHPLQLTATGDLKVTLDSEVVSVDLGANNDVIAAGDVAHDAADSGNPVKVGGVAYNFDGSAPGTAVAEGDRAEFAADVYGRQLVETAHPNFWSVSADYASAQTNTTVKAAPGAGLKLYITDIIISNGATAGNITLLDGSGGTVLVEIYPAANGGLSTNFRTPIPLTANTLLAITSTTVTTHSVTINGYIAP